MSEKQPITEDLLGKFLAQETDAQESALVENWLNQDKEHQKELDDYQYIWQKVASLKEEKNVNVDMAWNKVKSKMDLPKEAKNVKFVPRKQVFFTPFRIAASITLLLVAGLLAILLSQRNTEIISLKTTNHTLEKTLPDGSIVFLNTNTTFSYPTDFQQDTREVSLNGEAFFKVKRDESKPFIIHANGSDVKVLGTSFNVRAYDKNVRVSVETGKVQFKNKAKQTLLVRGEEAEFVADKDTIRRTLAMDKNVFAYKTKIFVFENSSLEHIIKVLSEGYHTKILLKNDRIKTCRLTTKFDNETLPNALNVIAETLNLNITAQGEKYIIDGNGCSQ
ncbi:FecR family protein [Emticicia sp. SJ17W-69]|uniref:FecR family protein n=1 Tax=Emticicia sp. SJ17W-69 TaxID=3421657 RepID=UPI003EB795FA